jgi:hypothetical protein
MGLVLGMIYVINHYVLPPLIQQGGLKPEQTIKK